MSAALIWLLLGLVLLMLELIGAEFEGLLACAIAALVVSAISGLAPLPVLLQVGLFAALTVVLLKALHSWGGRRQRAIAPASSSEQATVISGFEASDQGRVHWQGQSWAATNLESDQTLGAGAQVVVMGRDGNRLQILPASSSQ